MKLIQMRVWVPTCEKDGCECVHECERVVVQRGMNKGMSCFLETIAMDHWVRTLGGGVLKRPKNGRGNPVRTELGRGWSGGGSVRRRRVGAE